VTSRPELERVIRNLADRHAAIEVGTVELCFLLALHVRGAAGQLASFSEAQLEEVYEAVSAVVQPDAESVRRRAGAAIQRLRDQRMLARVDGQGVVRSGEFALSRLATAIVEFFLDDDVLTEESLGALTRTLETTLGELAAAARRADGSETWQRTVTAPLQVTIGELVTAIERRQRGLDLRQEDFQGEIRGLLEADWFGALDRCQTLLESTGAALRDLNDVLLRDTSKLLALLQDVQELAVAAGEEDAEAAALRLCDQVDRIAAWGGARQRAWSEYFQHVHRYLRDVVRLDPSRALTQRLREQMAGAGGRAWTLAVAAAPAIRLLRTVTPVRDPAPVARPRAQREKDPAPDTGVDPQAALDDQVRGALAGGAAALSQVTAAIVGEAPEAERFTLAGSVAQGVARLARAESEHERPWVAVDQMLIEDWAIRGRRDGEPS
jgi:chromosome partition protein MukF